MNIRGSRAAIAAAFSASFIWAATSSALTLTPVARYSFSEPQSTATQLSGICYIGGDNYYAVSDHISQLYTLHIAIDQTTGGIDSFSIDPTTLQLYNSSGVAYSGTSLDAEGVALNAAANTVYVSSENLSNNGPTIHLQNLTTGLETIRINSASSPELGVYANCRSNLAWESLARQQNTGTMWTTNQEAVKTDGPTSTITQGSTLRLQRFDANGNADGQYAYQLDANTDSDWTSMGLSCVSDLLALPNGDLIALERASGSGRPGGNSTDMRIRLYEIDYSHATDLLGEPLNDPTYVTKTLLWQHYFDASNNNQFEGIALGPTLANGNSSILLIADNGGGTTHTLYALEASGVPEPTTLLFILPAVSLFKRPKKGAKPA